VNRLGLELLTLLGMPPVEHVRLAAKLGCSSISTALTGLRLDAFGYPDLSPFPAWSLESDIALRREMRQVLRDTGVQISLGEGFHIRAGHDVRTSGPGLDIMAELGAQRINAVSMEPDMARTLDQLALLAGMVTERNMSFTVEFAPPNTINSLPSALAVIDHIGRGRCRLLLDAMHFFRSGATVADLATLDPDLIGYAQLCDAPLVSSSDNYLQEAIFARRVPGTGELPLREWVAALPADVTIGLEVPMISVLQQRGSLHDHAAQAVAAARQLGA